MMLGKRSRPAMKRNTSMTEFTLDFNGGSAAAHPVVNYQPSDLPNPFNAYAGGFVGSNAACPRLHRHNSADFVETAHFLRVCSMCQRRLIPGRDIYMYRGDSAFCSLECRHNQIIQDEKKEKFSLPSNKEAATSATGETIAAV